MATTKLVRDNIPELVKNDPRLRCYEATPAQYILFLNRKLTEEVDEYLADYEPYELADILEVVYAIAATYGISVDQLHTMMENKAAERGRFDKHYLLKR